MTRKTLLIKLDEAGFGKDGLNTLQKLIDAEKATSIMYWNVYFNSDRKSMTREARVAAAQVTIFALLNVRRKNLLIFVLSKYIESGVDELDQEKLPTLLELK